MKLFIAAIAISAAAIAAPAGKPSDAFECKLPYRASVEATAKLKIAKQTSEPATPINGVKTTIELVPGETRIFGQKPLQLSMQIKKAKISGQQNVVEFVATFPRSPQVDTALVTTAKLSTCPEALKTCVEYPKTPDLGNLSYSRHRETTLVFSCRHFVKETDLAS